MNISKKSLAVLAVVFVQVVFFSAWYAYESNVLGQEVKVVMVKPEPYDPRDLLSGQYFRINYAFSNAWSGRDGKRRSWAVPIRKSGKGDYVWITLREESGFYEPIKASIDKPHEVDSDDVVIRGKCKINDCWRVHYGIEKYFVPEGTKAPEVENMKVALSVYEDGRVRIKQVYVNDQPWP